MKKIVATLLSLVLLLTLACPVFATESIFIPSNGMEVLRAEMKNEDVKECVVVTSVPQAKDQSTDITQDARNLLVEIYDALSDGSMELPVEGEFRYLELADVSFAENACIQDVDHEDEKQRNKYDILHETDATLTVEFEIEIVPEGELLVLAYIDEAWELVENVTDLGDGKVLCTFEDICPVVFIDREGDSGSEPPTDVITTEPAEYPIARLAFVPSITYKDGLEITDGDTNIETIDGTSWGDGIDACVVVTSIAQAIEKSTDISQDDRDLLLELYEALAKGEMELPLKSGYVIRDLVDISFEYDDCRCIEEHGHKDECLAEDGVTLTLTFDMDVPASAHVTVMAYVDGDWSAIKSVVNNGDGTVTCIFEDICPVAFVVDETGNADGPLTGDAMGQNMWIWMTVMAACVAGITILLLMKRKKVV